MSRFSDPAITDEFKVRIGGAFEPLLQLQYTDVEDLWSKFRDTTNNITEEVVGRRRAKLVKGLPENVVKACEERRKARIQKINNPNERNKEKYNELNKTVKCEVKRWKKTLLTKDVEEMEKAYAKNNSHMLFKTVRKLAGERNNIQLAAKNKDGILKTAPHDVMECWKDHFSTHLNMQFPRDEASLDTIPEPPPTSATNQPFTIGEVDSAIKSLKNNKACGWDKISAETIKAGGMPMRQMLLKIINTSWSQKKTPEDWSRGLITPVHKKGDKLDPANYRAIALLSIPGKVFCRMVLTRIQETIDSHLTEEQCGFRSARGTTDATFTVRQLFEKSKERRTPIHWNFVDFKAAFDTIWREALWKCLRSTGADKVLVELIEYMYNQSKCAVIVNGKISEWFEVMTGVRQGCLLSPSLFNLFLELIMKDVQNLDSGIQMGHIHINNIRYADDTTLLDHDIDHLQIATDNWNRPVKMGHENQHVKM